MILQRIINSFHKIPAFFKRRVSVAFRPKISLEFQLIFFFAFLVVFSVLFTYLLTNYVFMNIIKNQLDRFSVETLRNRTNLLDTNLKQYDLLLRDLSVNHDIHETLNANLVGTYENAEFSDKFSSTYASIAIQLHTNDLICVLLRSRYDTYYSPRSVIFTGSPVKGDNIANYQNSLYNQIQSNQGKVTFLPTEDYAFFLHNQYKSFAMGRLIRDYNGTELGYILAFINYDFFDKVLFETAPSENTTFGIFDQERVIYARSKSSDHLVVLQDFLNRLPADKNSQLVNYDGTLYLVTYYTSTYSGWTSASMTPMSDLYQGMQVNRNLVLLVILVLMIVSILFSIYIALTITNPIINLIQVTRGISAGDLTLRAGSYQGMEMRELGSHFNNMVEKVNLLLAENEQKQKALVQTELSMLQAQINPHFLHNTLNSIRWMSIINKQDQIKNMVDHLARLILNTFRQSDIEILIEDELDILESYINLMKVRYTHFNVVIDAAPLIRRQKILKFILQPFIENSILYGFAGIDYLGEIKVSFRNEHNNLLIHVSDNGVGSPEQIRLKLAQQTDDDQVQFNRIGIRNVHKRIQLHYGSQYGLNILANSPGGVIIEMILPIIE